MVWIVSSISLHPSARAYSSMTEAQRDVVTRKAAELFNRLLLVDCRAETLVAFKTEEPGAAIQTAFSQLGTVAMEGLTTDPAVAAGLGMLSNYLDSSKLSDLAKAATTSKP